MTTSTWTATAGGNWAQALDWSTHLVPVAGDTANLTQALLGPYDVDVTDIESASVVNVGTINVEFAVESGGVFTANTINLNAGTLAVLAGAEIVGATIVAAPSTTFRPIDGTLAGVVWQGPMVLAAVTQSDLLTVTTSLTLLNANGTGSGELDLNGPGGEVAFSTLTLDGQAGDAGLQINVTNPGSGLSSVLAVLTSAALTIGAHAHVNLGGNGDVQIASASTGGGLVNNGVITASATTAEINVGGFSNAGTVNVMHELAVAGAIAGTGTVNISVGAMFELGGAASGGTVNFAGGGGTLKLDAPSSFSETISGLTATDVIHLVGTSVKSAVISGSTLSVTETNNTVLTYHLGSANPPLRFVVTPDGNNGSDLTATPADATKNDFSGDGKSDLIWQNGGTFTEWQSTGSAFTPNTFVGSVGAGWTAAGVGDFSGDGKADVIWQNGATFTEWQSTGSGFTPNTFIGSVGPGWTLAGVGDFSGDGKSDLIWQNGATFTEWQSTGSGFTPNTFVGSVGAGWTLAGVGDFNGDGKADVIWQNGATFTEWQSTGSGFTPNTFVGSVGAGWTLAAVGDFSGDGKNDLIWQNGATFTEWQSTGSGFTPNTFVGSVGPGWTLAGVGDFSGDGKADVIWQNGATFTEWQSTGSGFTPNTFVGTVGAGWKLDSSPATHAHT
jgi:hypothetical protein